MTPVASSPAQPSTASSQGLSWQCLAFDQLSVTQLYAWLQLRTAVFVVEQACVFQDMDGADPACHHLLAWDAAGQLLAAARLVPAGLKYPQASIGRVVTSPAARGLALGHTLMARACDELQGLWGAQPIRIGAQAHLQSFYGRHGFVTDSPPYDEDGIAHVEMLRPADPPTPPGEPHDF